MTIGYVLIMVSSIWDIYGMVDRSDPLLFFCWEDAPPITTTQLAVFQLFIFIEIIDISGITVFRFLPDRVRNDVYRHHALGLSSAVLAYTYAPSIFKFTLLVVGVSFGWYLPQLHPHATTLWIRCYFTECVKLFLHGIDTIGILYNLTQCEWKGIALFLLAAQLAFIFYVELPMARKAFRETQ
jgi:hypothetical protein